MKRKTINDFKIKNYRTVPILEQTKSPFGLFDKSDSKKIYDLIEEAVFALKHENTEAEQARLQRFSYLLCEEIKSNFQELLGDEKTIKKFKEEITKKISKDLKLDNLLGESLFTETDVALAVESAIKSLTDHKFLEKYINVLSKKETEKVIQKFSEELSKDKKFETSIDNLLKNPQKNSEILSSKVKNLVSSTATATKLQDNIIKLSAEIEAQEKKKEEKKKSSSSLIPTIETPKNEPSTKSSLFGNLFKFSALGITIATATKLTSLFDFGKKKKEEERRHESLWAFTKSKLTYDFFKITNTVSTKFKNALNSVWDFGKKSAGAVWKLLKYTTTGILKIIASPFTLLFSGIKKVFWEEDQSVSENIKTLLKRLIFSGSFFYFLGMTFGLVYKLIMAGVGKMKVWWGNLQEKAEKFKEWVENFKENWKTILSEKLEKAWKWIKTPKNWINLGKKIGKAIGKIFPKDVIGSLKKLWGKLESSWEIIKKAIVSGPIHWVIQTFKALKHIIEFIKTTKFGANIMSVAGAAWKVVPTFLGKIIALGIGIFGAVIPAVLVKLFKGWGDDKKSYELDNEYRRSLGISISEVGKNLTSQFKDDTPEKVKNSVEDMIGRNMSTAMEISEFLGGSEHEDSLAWWMKKFEHTSLDFRKLKPEVLNPMFSFGFISNDKKAMQPFNLLSTELMNFFLTDPSLDERDRQYQFLKNLTQVRMQFLMFVSDLMRQIGLSEFTKMIKDSDNYITPLFDIFNELDYKKFSQYIYFPAGTANRNLFNLKERLANIYKTIGTKNGGKIIDGISLRYKKGVLQFFVNGKGIDIPNGQYRAYLQPKKESLIIFNDLKNFFPVTRPIARDIFMNLPYDIQPFILSGKDKEVSMDLPVNKLNAFDYMVNAMDSTSETLEELKLNPSKLEDYSWNQLSYVLAGEGEKRTNLGAKISDKNIIGKIQAGTDKSKVYLMNLLIQIFDAASEAGILE